MPSDINLSKSELGKVSKAILETVNTNLVDSLEVTNGNILIMLLTGLMLLKTNPNVALFN